MSSGCLTKIVLCIHFQYSLPKGNIFYFLSLLINMDFQYNEEKKWWEETYLRCTWVQWESSEFLTIKYDVSCPFFVVIIKLRTFTSVPSLQRILLGQGFVINGFWILPNTFLHLFLYDHVIFLFQSWCDRLHYWF